MAKKVNKEETVQKKTTAKKTVKPKNTDTKKTVEKKVAKAKQTETKKVATKKDEEKKVAKKVVSKKATTKKVASKKPVKKKTEAKLEEVKENETVINDTVENVTKTKPEETNEVKENEIAEEATVSEETSVNEIKNQNDKVSIDSSMQSETLTEKPKKKKNIFLRIVISVVIVACALLVALMCLANNITAIEEHFDPIDVYKDELVIADEDREKSKEVLLAINLLNNITFDENTLDATLAVTKPVVYNYFDLDTLNNSDFIKNNKLVVNQFGYELDPENNLINVYAAVKYNNFLNVGIQAQLEYEFTDSDLVIKFKDAKIGNLPDFLYKNKLPETGSELYRQNISDFNVINDIKVRLLDPQKIKDIKYEDNTVYISLNMEDAINDLINELFDTTNGDSKFAQIANYYLQQLFNGSTNIDYTSMIDDVASWAQQMIGEVDLESIGNLISIFAN